MTTKTKHNLALVGICLFVLLGVVVAVLMAAPRNVMSGPVGATGVPAAGFNLPMANLEGKWSAEENDTVFIATVQGDDIKIEMVMEDNVSALYWHGTFKSQESPKAVITSTKTESPDEIVISQSTTKDFTIGGDSIMFKFSALGFSKDIELRR